MKYSKAIEVMMQLKAEYFNSFKDMPDDLFKTKVNNFMKALEGYTDTEIDIALGFVLKECKTIPTTAHFVEILERNRELILPSPEEEWNMVSSVITKLKRNIENIYDLTERRLANKENYESLSLDVREYYINYSGFLDLLETKNLEFAKSQFLKGFPEWRKRKRQKEQLMENCNNGT